MKRNGLGNWLKLSLIFCVQDCQTSSGIFVEKSCESPSWITDHWAQDEGRATTQRWQWRWVDEWGGGGNMSAFFGTAWTHINIIPALQSIQEWLAFWQQRMQQLTHCHARYNQTRRWSLIHCRSQTHMQQIMAKKDNRCTEHKSRPYTLKRESGKDVLDTSII